jgi:hypothetical protein
LANLGQDSLDLAVLSLQVLLDVACRVERGVGVFVGGLSAQVRRRRLNVLAHDDAEQHQLEKRLTDPRDNVTALCEAMAPGDDTNANAAKA